MTLEGFFATLDQIRDEVDKGFCERDRWTIYSTLREEYCFQHKITRYEFDDLYNTAKEQEQAQKDLEIDNVVYLHMD